MKFHYTSHYGYELSSNSEDVGWDIRTPFDICLKRGEEITIDTGIVVDANAEAPFGPQWWFMIVPRSSSRKTGLYISNTIGIVDPPYCGPNDTLQVNIGRRNTSFSLLSLVQQGPRYILEHFGRKRMHVAGDKIAQLVFFHFVKPDAELRETLKKKTDRGGHGSTGR